MKRYSIIGLSDLILDLNNADISKVQQKLKRFSCDREDDVQRFLHNNAISFEKSGLSRTYLIIDVEEHEKGNFEIMAFFSIAAKCVDISGCSRTQKRKLIGQVRHDMRQLKYMPSILIGQLSRNDAYNKLDISGETIISQCFIKIKDVTKLLGGRVIYLECKDVLVDYYSKYGFIRANKGETENFNKMFIKNK